LPVKDRKDQLPGGLQRVRETYECTGRADSCTPVVVASSSRITADLAEARDLRKSVGRRTSW